MEWSNIILIAAHMTKNTILEVLKNLFVGNKINHIIDNG